MRKIVAVASVAAVLGIGISLVAYNLIRTGGQFGRIDFRASEPREETARVQQPRPTEPEATEPNEAPLGRPAPVADVEPAAELTADERSPFGHATDAQAQADGEPALPEGAPRAAGDATSMAPLLADARATLGKLLDEAADDPDAAAELGALLADRAPLEALLEDPDPAVREEAAALLDLLGRRAP